MAEQQVERFERLVLPHLDDAYTLARYLLRDEHDAQDVVQEAVLRALRHFAGLRQEDARAWLLTIVRNCCYSLHKARRKDRSTVPITNDAAEEVADPGSTDDLAIEGSERERVQAAVDALPAELREVSRGCRRGNCDVASLSRPRPSCRRPRRRRSEGGLT